MTALWVPSQIRAHTLRTLQAVFPVPRTGSMSSTDLDIGIWDNNAVKISVHLR